MNLKFLSCLIIPLWVASCVPPGADKGLRVYQEYDLPAKLPKDPAKVVVKVSLRKQRAYVIEGSQLLLAMPVSVGAVSSPTPQGQFRIFDKNRFHRANSHGYAFKGGQAQRSFASAAPAGWSFKGTPMPYWCEFKPNYGFHTGWLKREPCTHGCIRMHENLAPKFFRLVSIGTPVSIAATQAEDVLYGDMKLPPDAGPLPDYGADMYTGEGYFSRHKAPVFE